MHWPPHIYIFICPHLYSFICTFLQCDAAEESGNVFGAILIQLQSDFSGGELIVHYQSEETSFDFGGPAGVNNFHYVTFFTSCQLDIGPSTKGYRLFLIYNLVYKGSGRFPGPRDYQKQLISAIEVWSDSDAFFSPSRIVYLLENKYCKRNLSFRTLKSVDQAIANFLLEAQLKMDFDVYMCNVQKCHDEALAVDFITSPLGSQFKRIRVVNISKECLVPKDFFEDEVPDDEEIATLCESDYSWTALLFWPRNKRVNGLGKKNMINLLKDGIYENSLTHEELGEDAKDIIDTFHPRRYDGIGIKPYVTLLQCLHSLKRRDLIPKLLEAIPSIIYSRLFNCPFFKCELLSIGSKFGWEILSSPLQAMFKEYLHYCSGGRGGYFDFLLELSIEEPLSMQKSVVCKALAAYIVNFLSQEENDHPVGAQRPHGKNFACSLLRYLVVLEYTSEISSLVKVFRSKPELYPVLTTLAPAVESLFQSTTEAENVLQELLSYCVSTLEVSISKSLLPQESLSVLCPCQNCSKLNEFLEQCELMECRFKVITMSRNHMIAMLGQSGCDVSYTVEKKGSPFTLVVTKNSCDERDAQRHEKEKSILSCLKSLSSRSNNELPPHKKQKTQ